jgi:hypothetical protein
MIQIQKHTKQDKSKRPVSGVYKKPLLSTLHIERPVPTRGMFVPGRGAIRAGHPHDRRQPHPHRHLRLQNRHLRIRNHRPILPRPRPHHRPAGTPARNPDSFKSIKKKRRQLAPRGNGESEFLCLVIPRCYPSHPFCLPEYYFLCPYATSLSP